MSITVGTVSSGGAQGVSGATVVDLAQSVDGGEVRYDADDGKLRFRPRYGKVEVVGHSIAGAVGLEAGQGFGAHMYPSLVAGMLHADILNYAIGGAIMSHNGDWTTTGDGGYGYVRQTLRRDYRLTAPWSPKSSLAIAHGGLNDMVQMGYTGPLIQAIRSIIGVFREAARFDNTDASVVFGANWSAWQNQSANAGFSAHYTQTEGASFTVAVPATHQGEVDLAFTTFGKGYGSIINVSVDGGAATPHDLRDTSGNGWVSDQNAASFSNGLYLRLTGLSAGAHTLTVSMTSIQGTLSHAFDYWAIPASTPPVVLVPLQHKLGGAGTSSYTRPDNSVNTFNEAQRAQLNTALTNLCAEWADGLVIPVDLDAGPWAINGNAAYLGADGVHPNDIGHQRVAMTMAAAALDAPVDPTTEAYYGLKYTPRSYPLWFKNAWTNYGIFENGSFTRSADGYIQMAGMITKATTPGVNEIVCQLPPKFRPAKRQRFACQVTSTAPAAGAAMAGIMDVYPDGNVYIVSGVTTGAHIIDLSPIRFLTAYP